MIIVNIVVAVIIAILCMIVLFLAFIAMMKHFELIPIIILGVGLFFELITFLTY